MTDSLEAQWQDVPLGRTLEFLRTLWSLNHALEVMSKRMLSTLGVTAQQRMVLRIVGRFPGISASHLAHILRIHPATLSTTLKRLEKRGLVERRHDPRDQRRVVLGLTAEGRVLDEPRESTVESVVEAALQKAAPEEIAATQRLLLLLVTQLQSATVVTEKAEVSR